MKTGQFYKGMINGTEDSYESPDIYQVLPKEKLDEYWDKERVGTYNRVFLSEHVILKTVISKSEPDGYGREGIINHTVIYRFDPYIEHDGLKYVLDTEQFLKDVKDGKIAIKQLKVPELKKPLDAPPALEVQA
jgi:hypothetical protein